MSAGKSCSIVAEQGVYDRNASGDDSHDSDDIPKDFVITEGDDIGKRMTNENLMCLNLKNARDVQEDGEEDGGNPAFNLFSCLMII